MPLKTSLQVTYVMPGNNSGRTLAPFLLGPIAVGSAVVVTPAAAVNQGHNRSHCCYAGAISGMVGICAGQPLDTLRVRLQQKGSQQGTSAAVLRAGGAKALVHDLFRGLS